MRIRPTLLRQAAPVALVSQPRGEYEIEPPPEWLTVSTRSY